LAYFLFPAADAEDGARQFFIGNFSKESEFSDNTCSISSKFTARPVSRSRHKTMNARALDIDLLCDLFVAKVKTRVNIEVDGTHGW
jgi:hypothetical protein